MILKDNKTITLKWEGRRLVQYGLNKYSYNENGIRVYKETENSKYKYRIDGNKILSFIKTENNINYEVFFKYDDTDQIFSLTYNNQDFYYIRDITGNINKIVDSNGKNMINYSYNAWGLPKAECEKTLSNSERNIAATILQLNPFLYKGYYYDVETSLFWISSRYYSPELCRWISPDDIEYLDPESINGLNLYCYCFNNPIMYIDPDGHEPKWWQWALFGVGVALVEVAAGMAIIATGGVGAFGVGALIGSLAVGAGGAVVGGAIGYATEGVDGILGGALAGFGIGAIIGFAVGGTIGYYNSLVKVDIRKFTEYVLDPTNSKGKDVIFNNLGYDKTNAKSLARLYKKQGLKNFLKKNYTYGKLDIHGQRYNMAIKIGNKVLNSGWIQAGKGIRLVSPFVGFL